MNVPASPMRSAFAAPRRGERMHGARANSSPLFYADRNVMNPRLTIVVRETGGILSQSSNAAWRERLNLFLARVPGGSILSLVICGDISGGKSADTSLSTFCREYRIV